MLGDIFLAINIYLVTGYTDMRKSIDGLSAIIMKNFKQEPDGHSIYLFCSKRCDRIKVLFKEPDGYILLYKRLECFIWKIPLDKEQFRGKTYHLATIRLAYVWFCNRTAKGTSNVVKPLYLEGAEKLPFFLK